MDGLWIVLSGVVGLVAGAVLVFWVTRSQVEGFSRAAAESSGALTKAQEEAARAREERAGLEARLDAERSAVQSQREQFEKQLRDTFAELSNQALDKNSRRFLELAEQNLAKFNEQAKGDLEKRHQAIGELVKPIEERLKDFDESIKGIEKERVGAYEQLREQVKSLAEDQTKLRSETHNLVRALRNPQQRGRWGEMQLETILKLAGLEEGVHFRRQEYRAGEEGGVQPDTVVFLPSGREIVIDSKAPLEAYLDAQETGDEDLRNQKLREHARHVKQHVQALTKKAYWDRFESADFVIMFLPGESLFSAAVQADASLLEFGVENRVFIASPMTLITMLRSVAMGWRQERLADDARKIADEAKELYGRLTVMGKHFRRVGERLDGAVGAYNDTVGSIDTRLMPQLRRLKELNVASTEEFPAQEPVERTTRELQSPEMRSLPTSAGQSADGEIDAEGLFSEPAESPASGA